ncbi:unnamed protein product [Somion occarium]|uniref:Exoribonuclease phosphorolytic domain-containing protein n=1 Tax=Somion occarium TaxID=3059160 RepID=A0ABP1CWH3_9APHY
MIRNDGRSEHEFRKVEIVYEGLDRVDGSARFAFGQTESIVSVSGPVEVRPASENPSQATLDIFIRPLASLPGTDAKSISNTLKSIFTPALLLSQHPRTLIQLVAQALCGSETGSGTGSAGRGWNSSLIATLINATTAALVNASSVPMKGTVCAVAVGTIGEPSTNDRIFVVDPSEVELPSLTSSGCFAFMFSSTLPPQSGSLKSVVPPSSLIWTNFGSVNGTPFDENDLTHATKLGARAAAEIWLCMKESLATIEKKPTSVSQAPGESKKAAVKVETESDDEKMEIS